MGGRLVCIWTVASAVTEGLSFAVSAFSPTLEPLGGDFGTVLPSTPETKLPSRDSRPAMNSDNCSGDVMVLQWPKSSKAPVGDKIACVPIEHLGLLSDSGCQSVWDPYNC